MNSLYDIVISLTIGATIISMLIFFTTNVAQEGSAQTICLMTQTNCTSVTDILDFEFRKMGFRVPASHDSSIVFADSNKIKFKGDLNNDGTVDTLTYYLNTAAASGMANTNTRVLYKTLNLQAAQPINIGITRFRLSYYDANGNAFTTYPVSRPSQIKSLKLALNVESTVPFKPTTQGYLKLNPGVYWERTFKPKNLR